METIESLVVGLQGDGQRVACDEIGTHLIGAVGGWFQNDANIFCISFAGIGLFESLDPQILFLEIGKVLRIGKWDIGDIGDFGVGLIKRKGDGAREIERIESGWEAGGRDTRCMIGDKKRDGVEFGLEGWGYLIEKGLVDIECGGGLVGR